jgi:Rrf2 family protein
LQSRSIAESEELPGKFLESILLALRSANILESKVGAGGGYRLSRGPDEIRVSEMVAALNGAAEDDVESGSGGITPGNASLAVVNNRIDEALDRAFGTLSLSDLLSIAESRTQGAPHATRAKA